MTEEIPIGNHSGCYGIIVSGTGYDFFVARDIIFERLGRKLVCECEMLRDDKKLRRLELERMFGVDFGESGRKGTGIDLSIIRSDL